MALTGFLLAAGASAGLQIYQAEEQRKEAKRARRATEQAQREAHGAALRQELAQAESERRARRTKPDISAFLAQLDGKPTTAVSGTAGVRPNELLLSRITPLGTS